MAEVLKHHKARKRFGQNFLNDDFWINKIAEAVDPKEGQTIIEIGPGQAAPSTSIALKLIETLPLGCGTNSRPNN